MVIWLIFYFYFRFKCFASSLQMDYGLAVIYTCMERLFVKQVCFDLCGMYAICILIQLCFGMKLKHAILEKKQFRIFEICTYMLR